MVELIFKVSFKLLLLGTDLKISFPLISMLLCKVKRKRKGSISVSGILQDSVFCLKFSLTLIAPHQKWLKSISGGIFTLFTSSKKLQITVPQLLTLKFRIVWAKRWNDYTGHTRPTERQTCVDFEKLPLTNCYVILNKKLIDYSLECNFVGQWHLERGV